MYSDTTILSDSDELSDDEKEAKKYKKSFNKQ